MLLLKLSKILFQGQSIWFFVFDSLTLSQLSLHNIEIKENESLNNSELLMQIMEVREAISDSDDKSLALLKKANEGFINRNEN
jgi:hypothetical protein